MKELTKYTDMAGDPVYDYIVSELMPGGEILGAQIEEAVIHAVGSPRKTIHVVIFDREINQAIRYSLNYNKLYRELKHGRTSTRTDIRSDIQPDIGPNEPA